ncbi:MAG TPA: glutathione S-transferase family protein [Polyangiales bacterium]|nr:glutathione S-transferase family protein [Polyangiales bacterium]
MPRVLYQFPISHYCEKARWVLDYKGLGYRIHNQLPGPHVLPNLRRTGKRTVPLLVDGDAAISGSHAIALYLEAQAGGPPLLPPSAAGRAELEKLAHYFDDEVAPQVRRYAYGLILPRTELFREVFFRDYGPLARAIGRAMAKPLGREIGRMYRVRAAPNQALDVVRTAADRVEGMLRGGARYLLDDQLSLADITVASLLGPLVGPPRSPWPDDFDIPELRALREELRSRPIGDYITAQYAARPASTAA